MAAMKPRTGDGPLEVTKEGRGIVMRVPLEGGGRLVVELNDEEAGALGDALKDVVGWWSVDAWRSHSGDQVSATPTLPPQVSPPEFAVTAARPHALKGVEVIALPVLAGDDAVLLRPGSDEVGELLDVDLLAVLDADKATGKSGEITALPVPLGARDNAELRQVLL